MFTVNVEMVPSPLLITLNEEGEVTTEFEWTARDGIPKSIDTILKEFCAKESIVNFLYSSL